MVHTAELYTAITKQEYESLILNQNGQTERKRNGKTEFHIRALARYGITDIQPRKVFVNNAGGNIVLFSCVVILNLRRIADDGKRSLQTFDDESDIEKLSTNFAKFIKPILPLRINLHNWELRRIDYNIDLRFEPLQVEQYITLLQRGGKAHSWSVHETEEEKAKRKKSKHGKGKTRHHAGSVLYDNKQYSVNIYNKHSERLARQAERGISDKAELEASKGVLRIEIQAKRNKLNTIKSNIKPFFDFDGKPIEYFARYDIAERIIMQVLENITGRADYWSMSEATNQIIAGIKATKTRDAIIEYLNLVSHTKSAWRAKELYKGAVKTGTILKKLKALNINPVTIPKSFNRARMENLFDMVAVQFAEEREGQRGKNAV